MMHCTHSQRQLLTHAKYALKSCVTLCNCLFVQVNTTLKQLDARSNYSIEGDAAQTLADAIEVQFPHMRVNLACRVFGSGIQEHRIVQRHTRGKAEGQ